MQDHERASETIDPSMTDKKNEYCAFINFSTAIGCLMFSVFVALFPSSRMSIFGLIYAVLPLMLILNLVSSAILSLNRAKGKSGVYAITALILSLLLLIITLLFLPPAIPA
jgi:hypothetical protein